MPCECIHAKGFKQPEADVLNDKRGNLHGHEVPTNCNKIAASTPRVRKG
jgi:hypothetical protein